MRAVTFHGRRDVRVGDVPDPAIQEPTDAIVRVTTTGLCGSDLHLYEVLSMFMEEGDVLGHEPIGIVEEVGPAVTHIAPGDRVVVPFNIACGDCFFCNRELYAQCETTQVTEHGKGAALFGYTKLYGQVPGGQAEYLRVPQAHFGPIKVPEGPPDERLVYLADVAPTAWQAVEWAAIPPGGTCTLVGLGPIGQLAARIALHRGASRVLGIDLVPDRLAMAQRHGVEALDLREHDDVAAVVRERTEGRGTDAAIDAVGLEAHGSGMAKALQRAAGMLPDALAEPVTLAAGIDRLHALRLAIDCVRRGGTLSISGVYGGALDPLPLFDLFDKGIQIRMGQAHVRRWTDDLLPLVTDDADPLGLDDLTTHTLPLDDAPRAYELFQRKEDGAVKVLLRP